MPQRTTSGRNGKPAKPRPDFPLFPHATRRWAKKIRGKLHYFGPWDDPQGALNKYLDQKDDLHAGRKPRVSGDTFTLRDLLNRFLTSKKLLADSGEITARTFADYHGTCARVGAAFGLGRPVEDLAADDFEGYRGRLAKTQGPVAMGNEIQRVRSVFKYAFDEGLIDRPVRFGTVFRRPGKKVLRRLRQARGPRSFEAAELRALLAAARPHIRAMMLLGINCGFGNADCGTLPRSALDMERGWVNYPRPKTGIDRRCPLWPETVEALRAALAMRPEPGDPADAGLVFLTKYGKRWFKGDCNNPLSFEVKKLLRSVRRLVLKDGAGAEHAFYLPGAEAATPRGKALDGGDLAPGRKVLVREGGRAAAGVVASCEPVHRPRVNFYSLRRTFETVGGDARDQVAVDFIMGHADESMAGVYREKIGDERPRAVTDHVRAWLFGKEPPAAGGPSEAGD
jgi:integrase